MMVTDNLKPGRGYEIDAAFVKNSGQLEAIQQWCKDNNYTIEYISYGNAVPMADGSGYVIPPSDIYRLTPPKGDR